MNASLRGLATHYGIHSIDDLPYGAQPLERDDLEDEKAERLANLGWEQPAESWHPVDAGGTATRPPCRFIDGSVNGRTVAVLDVAGGLRPALLAVVGAMAMELRGRVLRRCGDTVRTESVFCLFANQFPATDLDALQAGLTALGIGLGHLRCHDFDTCPEFSSGRSVDTARSTFAGRALTSHFGWHNRCEDRSD